MIDLTKAYIAFIERLGPAQGAAIQIVVIGVVATLATDLWQRLHQAIAGLPLANWGLIGRWVASMPRGIFVHRPITATPKVQGEVAVGWAFHYVVGTAYAALYLAILRLGFGSGPTLASAPASAIVLLVAPWFVMQPPLGLGFMAARTTHPAAVHAVNVSVHAIFGLGPYLGTVISQASLA